MRKENLEYKFTELDNVYSKNNEFTIYDVLDYLNDNPKVLKNNGEIDVFNGKGQEFLTTDQLIIIPTSVVTIIKLNTVIIADSVFIPIQESSFDWWSDQRISRTHPI